MNSQNGISTFIQNDGSDASLFLPNDNDANSCSLKDQICLQLKMELSTEKHDQELQFTYD